MDRKQLYIFCTLGLASCLAPAGPLRAADAEPLRLAAFGVLERFDDDGGVRYALTDPAGDPTFEVTPAGQVDLQAFEGQRIEVVGTLHAGGEEGLREIRAEKVSPAQRLAPAHFIQVADDAQRGGGSPAGGEPPTDDPPLAPVPERAVPERAGSSPAQGAPDRLSLPPQGDFPELPPLLEGPQINDIPPELMAPMIVDDGSAGLQSPLGTLPPDAYDAYRNPAAQDPACGPKHWIWGEVDYLYWWTKGTHVPPLATASVAGTPQEEAGVLGLDSTKVLLGNESLLDDQRSGWRWVIGAWLGPQRRLGLQLDLLGLEDEDFFFRRQSNGFQIIARPFTNVDPNLGLDVGPDAELISFPNVTAGALEIRARNEFSTMGLLLRGNMLCKNGCFFGGGHNCSGNCSGYRLDLLGGYRYMQLEDSVVIEQLTAVSVTPQAGFHVFDRFRTDNNFQGGELGLAGQWYRDRWSFDGLVKLALGRTEQEVAIAGGTELTTVGIETPFEGGLLAQTTNIGRFSRKKTDVIPELGLSVGYLLSSNLRLNCGYRVIYWPKVARAGEHIDMTVNGSYIPDPTITPSGPLRPQFAFQDSGFWAQGLSLGVDYRW